MLKGFRRLPVGSDQGEPVKRADDEKPRPASRASPLSPTQTDEHPLRPFRANPTGGQARMLRNRCDLVLSPSPPLALLPPPTGHRPEGTPLGIGTFGGDASRIDVDGSIPSLLASLTTHTPPPAAIDGTEGTAEPGLGKGEDASPVCDPSRARRNAREQAGAPAGRGQRLAGPEGPAHAQQEVGRSPRSSRSLATACAIARSPPAPACAKARVPAGQAAIRWRRVLSKDAHKGAWKPSLPGQSDLNILDVGSPGRMRTRAHGKWVQRSFAPI